MRILNLFESVPVANDAECFETLAAAPHVRIERIVSHGQSSPAGFWYDQPQAEWILVMQGSPQLRLEGEEHPRHLRPGDSLLIPPHVRHRVEWTDPHSPTVWLAVHFAASEDGPRFTES